MICLDYYFESLAILKEYNGNLFTIY